MLQGCLVSWHDSRFGCERSRAQFPEQPFPTRIKGTIFTWPSCLLCCSHDQLLFIPQPISPYMRSWVSRARPPEEVHAPYGCTEESCTHPAPWAYTCVCAVYIAPALATTVQQQWVSCHCLCAESVGMAAEPRRRLWRLLR